MRLRNNVVSQGGLVNADSKEEGGGPNRQRKLLCFTFSCLAIKYEFYFIISPQWKYYVIAHCVSPLLGGWWCHVGSLKLSTSGICTPRKLASAMNQCMIYCFSCLILCDPMNRSTPGLPGHHQLLELTQTHVHRAGDAIQPSHPLSSPSPPAPNPTQHQSLFRL